MYLVSTAVGCCEQLHVAVDDLCSSVCVCGGGGGGCERWIMGWYEYVKLQLFTISREILHNQH